MTNRVETSLCKRGLYIGSTQAGDVIELLNNIRSWTSLGPRSP